MSQPSAWGDDPGTEPPGTQVRVDVDAVTTVVDVCGDLDLASIELLASVLGEAVAGSADGVTVDLSACGFACSRSFAVLEVAAGRLRSRGSELLVHAPPPSLTIITSALCRNPPFAMS